MPIRTSFLCCGFANNGRLNQRLYAWLKRPPSRRAIEDKLLLAEIRRVQADSHESYGYRRILQALIALCHKVDRDRIARLMRQSGIVAKSERTVQIHDSRYQSAA